MRINTIASLIENASVCVDVGSDHATLSKILIDQNRSKVVYNIEKNEKPFQNSVNNTKQYNNIFNVKSDGFKDFDSSLLIDYCTISGMGANTIVEILNNSKNTINNLILCANNNYTSIRKWAKENNWKIYHEKTILVNDIYYEIICLSKTKGLRLWTKKQINFGIRKIKKDDSLYIQKLKSDRDLLNIDFFKKRNKNKYKQLKKTKRYINKYEC